MAAKKSKKKISKIKMKACPCPDHKGKKLPATPEYWHKGGNPDGFQGYCKQWRNKTQNAANKAARKAAKRTEKKKLKKFFTPYQKSIALKVEKKIKLKQIPIKAIYCKECTRDKEPSAFQSNGKGGFRQPCKDCIAKKRAEQKKNVDRNINPI